MSGEYLTFPGGGTQFKFGALHYIEFIQNVSLFGFIIYTGMTRLSDLCFLLLFLKWVLVY